MNHKGVLAYANCIWEFDLMRTLIGYSVTARFAYVLWLSLFIWIPRMWATEAKPTSAGPWQIGTPIATYWAGPSLTNAVAQQMVEGGFNLVWCRSEKELDVAGCHGLRGLLTNGLLRPKSLDDPKRREQLDALISRVSKHPALYAYHLIDEPSASQFPSLGKLVAYLRERDPLHLVLCHI